MGTNQACEMFLPMLSAYVDTELAPTDRVNLERHLSACQECATRAADVRAASGLIRVGLDFMADEANFEDFSKKVMARMTPERPPLAERIRLFFSETFTQQTGTWVTVAATAAVMLLVGVPWVLSRTVPVGYAKERMEVQAVTVEPNEPLLRPVVLKNAAGDAIIFLSDSPNGRSKIQNDEIRREETGTEPDGSKSDERIQGGEL